MEGRQPRSSYERPRRGAMLMMSLVSLLIFRQLFKHFLQGSRCLDTETEAYMQN